MLEELLHLAAQGGMQSIDDLAGRLQVTPALVEAMLDDLERMGYLARIVQTCSKECSGCASHTFCSVVGANQMWSVTSKGLTHTA